MIRRFVARGMPVTLLCKRSKEPFLSPNWVRLQRHIKKHEKEGGVAYIRLRTLDEPRKIEGYDCLELAYVELFHPFA